MIALLANRKFHHGFLVDAWLKNVVDQGMEIEPIGIMRTCFGEKFAVPRQPGLCPSAWGRLIFAPRYRGEDFVRGIEGFSHLWVIFGFHETSDQEWSPTVRPPRLGGNERVGVFASRSTFRPNGLGLSLCRLDGVDSDSSGPQLLLGGVDLVDGTPIYDIKPYLAYCEAPKDAVCGYAAVPPVSLPVSVDSSAAIAFARLPRRDQQIICECLALDPRPAAHDDPNRIYGVVICGVNVRFRVGDTVTIQEISPVL